MKHFSALVFTTLFIIICLCASASAAFAQGHNAARTQTDSQKTVVNTQPSLLLKASMTTMIEPTPTFQAAVEHRLGKQTSMQHELGFITAYQVDGLRDYWGVRARSEFRYYLQPIEYNKTNHYFAAEGLVKYNVSRDEYWYCVDVCQYQQRVLRNHSRLTYGFALEYGFMKLYNDRFLIDFVTGLGIKSAVKLTDDLPEDFRTTSFSDPAAFGSLLTDMATYDYATNLILGLKFGFILK